MPFNQYFNAKLLLTSEYLVLNGAKALAVPLKFGQRMEVEDNQLGYIEWKSVAHDGSTWFSGTYSLADFSCIESNNPDIAKHPQRLMQAAKSINPAFLSESQGCHVKSTLNYPLLWGLGSSSTLIAAVAAWAETDPFALHFSVSKGSGYDIACAISPGPVVYSLSGNHPAYQPVKFAPPFAENIFFVYQGKKQDSAEGIRQYRNQSRGVEVSDVAHGSLLTEKMLNAASLHEFEQIITEHEAHISNILGMPTLKETIFYDLPGAVKSLGAWGGDFCMLTWQAGQDSLETYLKSKGLQIWFNFNDIVL